MFNPQAPTKGQLNVVRHLLDRLRHFLNWLLLGAQRALSLVELVATTTAQPVRMTTL